MISTAFIEENFGFHFVCVCGGGVWQGGWEGCLCVWWWWGGSSKSGTDFLHWMCGWNYVRKCVLLPSAVHVCVSVCACWFHATHCTAGARMMGPTHTGTSQLFWLCVIYKDFITRCFGEVFTLPGESKCQWHPSSACMSSVNKQGVSLAVLLLPADSLCQHQTRKCHLAADSCLCCTHTGTRREWARQLTNRLCAPPR